jgi:hypothetical protein
MQNRGAHARFAIKALVRRRTASGSIDGGITCSSHCGTRDTQNWQASHRRAFSCGPGLRRINHHRQWRERETVLIAHEHCLHSGPDCLGPMQTEHITYAPDTTAPICAFHNQVLRVMRLSLALSKSAVALRGKLTVDQRTKTIAVLKRHRFDPASVARTDAYCKELAAEQGILLGKLDYKKHRATPTRPDPVDGVRFRMSFQPETERGLVTCCKWNVRRVP